MKQKEKSSIDVEHEAFLNQLVEDVLPDSSTFEETPLRSASSQREQVREELLTAFKLEHLQALLNEGMTGLFAYIERESSEPENAAFNLAINQFLDNLNTQHFQNSEGKTYAQLLGLPQEMLEKIDKAGEWHFSEKKYEAAAGIYALLCIIHHIDASYWCRKGMALQAIKEYDQAQNCFEVAILLVQDDPGPLLLSAHCHYQKGEDVEARRKIERAQELMRLDTHYQQLWQSYLTALKSSKGGF